MEGDERLARARAEQVDGARDLAFSGSTFACQQHSGPRSGDLLRDAVHLLHRATGADEPLKAFGIALSKLAPQVLRFDACVAALESAFDDDRKRIEIDGLRKVIFGPRTHCGDARTEVLNRSG